MRGSFRCTPRVRRPRLLPARLLTAALLLLGLLGAGLAPVRAQSATEEGVNTLTGSVTVTNPFILDNTSEPYMMLLDMTAFVKRDRNLPPTLDSQTLAPLKGDMAKGAQFVLNLPIVPKGTVNNLAHGQGGAGVQVYSVEFASNSFGDPFWGPYEGGGWGTALSSLVTALGSGEVTGGTVVVYAPDNNERFPTGFGADGKLFTADDPVGPIPAGWTVVDLNSTPFKQIRQPSVKVTIEPGDEGFFDYSKLSFTQAFDKLLADLELRYPFTQLKHIDWNALKAEFRPRVEQAERNNDALAFNIALVDFANRFPDGHVGVDIPPDYIAQKIGGRLGMRVAQTDDGKVIVISVTQGLPADKAGIKLGAEIKTWNGKPVTQAVNDVPLLFPQSTAVAARLERYEFLTRGKQGDTVQVTFANPGSSDQTVKLTFGKDINGRDVAANTRVSQPTLIPGELPISAKLLDSGIGYIKITSFDVDPVLMSTAWEYALRQFKSLGATGLIVDVRSNPGGFGSNATYVAGSFYKQPFDLFTTYFNDAQGKPIKQDTAQVLPAPVQWDAPVAVLINTDCASACEIFTGAMAHNPDHLIVGYTPTAGVEAAIYLWALPGNLRFQAPIGALKSGNSFFLEGVGVPPNVRVPATAQNLLDPGDVVLTNAEQALGPRIQAFQAAQATATPSS